jgi:tetratricopeptide (TPR) repeat protein
LLSRKPEADATMAEAMKLDPTVAELHQYGRSLLAEGRNDKALEIFKLNRERHKDDTFTTYVGMARGNAAVGNKKEAIKYWELVLKNLPENQKANRGAYEEELKKLKG